ncbi:hypothetical protein E6O51_11490 [Pseudothauera rhizosphaerae]|uniref:Nitrous oxide reductase accessory protein NosL n=2 Tax=Pseudothauera rhizosphaerae TaxID=2565932 RepID=A0A4S4AN66_9RHOO|nr:hypothetical protein E6O51_11490 [Pseudothauera rhizosphaerae]
MLPRSAPHAVDFVPPAEDVCIVPPARVAPAMPWNPDSGLPIHAARPVPAEVRCPVCGMYPARHPQWAAQIIFADGAAHFFDSPVGLFIFLEDTERYDPERKADTVAALYVTDFAAGGWIPAREARFVIDSAARGPMRVANLPAFAGVEAAAAFARANGGEVIGFADITPERIAALRAVNHAD